MQVIAFRELAAHIAAPLIDVTRGAGRAHKAWSTHERIGPRDQIKQLPDCGISHLRPLGITQHAAIHSEFLPVAHSFVGEEKECTVLPDGAAKGGAELVASERWLGLIEEVAGVKRIIAEELEHLAM